MPRWWPAVYLHAEELAGGDDQGIGQRVRLVTKGWLPYTLRWEFEVVDARYPDGFTLDASGDFNGRGEWTFVQDGSYVDVSYDWRIQAEKPLLRRLSFLMKPLFEANHRWAMRQGLTSLELELRRRSAHSPADSATIPPPPGPVTYAGAAIVVAGVAVAAGVAYLLLRSRKEGSRGSTGSRGSRGSRRS